MLLPTNGIVNNTEEKSILQNVKPSIQMMSQNLCSDALSPLLCPLLINSHRLSHISTHQYLNGQCIKSLVQIFTKLRKVNRVYKKVLLQLKKKKRYFIEIFIALNHL